MLLGIFISAIALLAMIKWQTVPGSMGQTAMSGGWWAEPALAPFVVLSITSIASFFGFLSAKKERLNWLKVCKTYGKIVLISGFMIGTVMLMKIIGFALSILVFSSVTGYIAGYRKIKLTIIALGTATALVLIFRVRFSIWFPRPLIFNIIALPSWPQGIL